MISVMIAEDELLVRMGIMSMVNWESMGMKVVSCVSDGLAALGDARKYHPDILITDIVMPGMDGINLLHTLNDEGIKPVCIVITALHQRQAIECSNELGIVACLVKATMTQRDITAALMQAKAKAAYSDSTDVDDDNFMRLSQMYGAALIGTPLNEPLPHAAAYVMCKAFANTMLDGVLGKTLTRLIIEEFPDCMPAACTQRDSRILIVYPTPLGKSCNETIDALMKLKRYVERNLAIMIEFVVLDNVPHRAEFSTCLSVILGELNQMSYVPGISWLDGQDLISALSAAQRASYINDALRYIWALRDTHAIYAAWQALSAFGIAENTSEQKTALDSLALVVNTAIRDDIASQQQACLDALHANIPDNAYHKEIARTVALLLGNLDREIKLSEAACTAGFHEAYFSTLFKQQLGMGFSRFCSAIRMEHAKYLLRSSVYTTNQISEMCGYRDMAYFCRVFKQTVGTTPASWRDRH